MLILSFLKFIGYEVKRLMNRYFNHFTVLSNLGLGDSILTIEHLYRMVSFHTAEPFVDTAVRIPLHGNRPAIGNSYENTATGAAETTGCFLPGN